MVSPRRKGVSLLVVGLLAAFAAWLTGSVLKAREDTRRSQCVGNLYQIGFALQNYHDRHGSFPPAALYGPDGKPTHSWRALLLIDWEETGFRGRYRLDEPWDGPHNRKLLGDGNRSLFSCPSDHRSAVTSKTSYVAVVGDDTLWSGDEHRTPKDFRSLPSNKILLIERPGSGIDWLEPRDLTVEQALRLFAQPGGESRSPHPGGLGYLSVGPEGERYGVLPWGVTADRLDELLRVPRPRQVTRTSPNRSP